MTAPAELRNALALLRSVHASLEASAKVIGETIRVLEWTAAPSVATSAPLKAVASHLAEYQRGGGSGALPPIKATPAGETPDLSPAKAPANAVVASVQADPFTQRPPVPGVPSADEDRMVTPDRRSVIEAMYPTGAPLEHIYQAVNRLPGRHFPKERIGVIAGKLKLHRPAKEKPAAPEPVCAALAPAPITRADAIARISAVATERRTGTGPLLTNFETVAAWAGARGIPFQAWDDLPRVNNKREQLGLPTFAREFSNRGAARHVG